MTVMFLITLKVATFSGRHFANILKIPLMLGNFHGTIPIS